MNSLDKYNHPEALIIITNYPPRGGVYGGKLGGVSGFGKNTARALANKSGRRVIIICEKLGKYQIYQEDKILVVRAFDRGSVFLYLQILRELLRFDRVRDILVEFEFSSYGGFAVTALFPALLLLLKLMGKNTVFALHQVVFDLSNLAGHLGFAVAGGKTKIFNVLLKIYYFLICLPVHRIIVLEQVFKNRLAKIVNPDKIIVIPHGVDGRVKLWNKAYARKKLKIARDEFVLLFFGFLTWYKGVDFLIRAVTGQKVTLIVAGGESLTQEHKPHYHRFLKTVKTLAAARPNVRITGFVKEKDLPLYFGVADLVVFPYRIMMSSSGPLSLALSFGKPFIMSDPLKGYLQSADFFQAIVQAGITETDLFFKLKSVSFQEKVRIAAKKDTLIKLSHFSTILAQRRDFESIIGSYKFDFARPLGALRLGYA